MKQLYVFIIGFVLWFQVGFGQCELESVNLYTQEDIDNFSINYPNCTTIGSLNIGFAVYNLNGLSQITTIEGNVSIGSFYLSLTDLSGLYNLTTVGGNMTLSYIPNLSNATNLFPNLTHIGGDLSVGQYTPTALSGFHNLTTIDGSLIFAGTDLVSLSGFENLTHIGDPLHIQGYAQLVFEDNHDLTTVTGFNDLTSIYGVFTFDSNFSVVTMPHFPSLSKVNGNLNIQFNHLLTNLSGLSSLTFLGGDLRIYDNTVLNNISALSHIQNFTNGIAINYNPELAVCNPGICNIIATASSTALYNNASGCNTATQVLVSCGIPQNCSSITLTTQTEIDDFIINYGCTEITGDLRIIGNNITNLNGLSQVTKIENLYLYSVPDLVDFSGFNQLTTITGNFMISEITSASISGFPALTSIGGYFSIYFTTALTSFTAMSNLTTVGGNFTVSENNQLSTMPSLPSLTSIGGHMSIYSNGSLVSMSGLDHLTTVGGGIYFMYNTQLTSLSELSNLTSINGQIYIYEADSLTTLSGLQNIDPAGISDLQLYSSGLSNCNLPNICSFLDDAELSDYYIDQNLGACQTATQVFVACGTPQNCDNVYIYSQADVDNYPRDHGCTTLTGALFISGNDITNLDGLSQLTSVDYLRIYDCPDLTDLSGLDNMTTVTRHLDLSGLTAVSVTLLPNLVSVGGNLTIGNNATTYLQSLHGFANLTSINGSLFIAYNPVLTELPVFSSLSSIGGELYVYNNDALTNLNVFPLLTSLNGLLLINTNPALNDISELGNMNFSAVTNISISGNNHLAVCNVPSICNYLTTGRLNFIAGNAPGCATASQILAACNPSCPSGDVDIANQFQVDDFNISYPGCSLINGNLSISGADISDLGGLAGITTITGSLTITGNSQLTTLSGLDNLMQFNGSLYVSHNTLLQNLDGLDGLTSVFTLEINDNQMLTNLDALSNLSTAPTFNLVDNPVLNDISGLSNINMSSTDFFSVSGCPNLAICNLSNICNYLSNDGLATITGNASGCGSISEVTLACGLNCRDYYRDIDEDGFGSGPSGFTCLETPTGYVNNDQDCDDNDALITTQCHITQTTLGLKLFIEGYYAGGGMMYSVQANQVEGGSTQDVEMMTIELHNATDYSLVDATTAMLHTDGTLTATFATVPANSYYIVVKGRNIIQTWSAQPQALSATALDYDFTTSATQAYGDNMIQMFDGPFAMMTGDVNQDDIVDGIDYSVWEVDFFAFTFGLAATDLNGDGIVDGIDNAVWENSFLRFTYATYPQ